MAKSQKKTFTKAFKNSKFDKTRHLLDLIWPRSGSELIVPFQNTHTVIENTMFKPHGADPRVSSHTVAHTGGASMHAARAHEQHTYNQSPF